MAAAARRHAGTAPPPIDLDTAALDRTLGAKGTQQRRHLSVRHPARRAGQGRWTWTVPARMGSANAINFQPTGGGKAAITGDFVLTAKEVKPVMKALRENGIEVTALHNHMLDEQPRLYFMHFWANDDAAEARGRAEGGAVSCQYCEGLSAARAICCSHVLLLSPPRQGHKRRPPHCLEAKIPLGPVSGRIDHLAIDLRRQRLFVAELGNDSVGVVDLANGKVMSTMRGFKEPQGIAYEPSTDTRLCRECRRRLGARVARR